MPRRPRGLITESFLHIGAKGNRGFPIYLRPSDYERFLLRLEEKASAHSVKIHAFCLMTNHLHVVVEAGVIPISPFMQAVLARHAEFINRSYQYRGHVFGGRFWSRVCRYDEDLLATIRYIHRNPVRAGIVISPEEYPWSSHRAYLGLAQMPWLTTRCLEFFGQDKVRSIKRYAEFVSAGPDEPHPGMQGRKGK